MNTRWHSLRRIAVKRPYIISLSGLCVAIGLIVAIDLRKSSAGTEQASSGGFAQFVCRHWTTAVATDIAWRSYKLLKPGAVSHERIFGALVPLTGNGEFSHNLAKGASQSLSEGIGRWGLLLAFGGSIPTAVEGVFTHVAERCAEHHAS
jgi:hypothetical protein